MFVIESGFPQLLLYFTLKEDQLHMDGVHRNSFLNRNTQSQIYKTANNQAMHWPEIRILDKRKILFYAALCALSTYVSYTLLGRQQSWHRRNTFVFSVDKQCVIPKLYNISQNDLLGLAFTFHLTPFAMVGAIIAIAYLSLLGVFATGMTHALKRNITTKCPNTHQVPPGIIYVATVLILRQLTLVVEITILCLLGFMAAFIFNGRCQAPMTPEVQLRQLSCLRYFDLCRKYPSSLVNPKMFCVDPFLYNLFEPFNCSVNSENKFCDPEYICGNTQIATVLKAQAALSQPESDSIIIEKSRHLADAFAAKHDVFSNFTISEFYNLVSQTYVSSQHTLHPSIYHHTPPDTGITHNGSKNRTFPLDIKAVYPCKSRICTSKITEADWQEFARDPEKITFQRNGNINGLSLYLALLTPSEIFRENSSMGIAPISGFYYSLSDTVYFEDPAAHTAVTGIFGVFMLANIKRASKTSFVTTYLTMLQNNEEQTMASLNTPEWQYARRAANYWNIYAPDLVDTAVDPKRETYIGPEMPNKDEAAINYSKNYRYDPNETIAPVLLPYYPENKNFIEQLYPSQRLTYFRALPGWMDSEINYVAGFKTNALFLAVKEEIDRYDDLEDEIEDHTTTISSANPFIGNEFDLLNHFYVVYNQARNQLDLMISARNLFRETLLGFLFITITTWILANDFTNIGRLPSYYTRIYLNSD